MEPTTIVLAIAAIAGLYMAWNIGANDVANNVGPTVGSGAMTMGAAIALAAAFEFGGAVVAGGDVVHQQLPVLAGQLADHRRPDAFLRRIAKVEVDDLPEHPNLIWLGSSPGTLIVQDNQRYSYTNIKFVARSPGTIQLPPVPAKIAGVDLRIAVPAFEVVLTDISPWLVPL